jgi:hypothetical protein
MLVYVVPIIALFLTFLLMCYYARMQFMLALWFFFLILLTLAWYDMLWKRLLTPYTAFLFCSIYFLSIAISISANRVNPNYFMNYVLIFLLCCAFFFLVVLGYKEMSYFFPVLLITYLISFVTYVVTSYAPSS